MVLFFEGLWPASRDPLCLFPRSERILKPYFQPSSKKWKNRQIRWLCTFKTVPNLLFRNPEILGYIGFWLKIAKTLQPILGFFWAAVVLRTSLVQLLEIDRC